MSTATETVTAIATSDGTLNRHSYPDPIWSNAVLNYYKDADAPPPDSINSTLSEHELRIQRRSDESPNVVKVPVRIRNIQGQESEYSIDKHGFTIAHLKSQMKDWRNETELKRVYFPEVSELLRSEIGAKEVFQYEHHVRTGTLEDALSASNTKGAVDINGPVRRVHIDESPRSAEQEFNYWMQPEVEGNERLKGRRFGIFNVWKPLSTVRRDPLCLCKADTVRDEDLQSGKVTVPGVGEIENFAIRPPARPGAHSFVYVREQRPEQCLVFRIYDGRLDSVDPGDDQKRSHGVAHTSFADPSTELLPPRESVEVRSFCIF